MIKQLIIDIAYNNITVSQALSRSKLIAHKINNKIFLDWIKKEIEGYGIGDELPEYRVVPSPVFIVAEFPFGEIKEFEVLIPDNYGEEAKQQTYFHRVAGPINTIVENFDSMDGPTGHVALTAEQVKVYSKLYRTDLDYVIRRGYRKIGKTHLNNIIELTNQKLIDILMELDKEFPNLDNDFINTQQNIDKIQNIVTNNIYGNNNSLNSATGSKNSISSQYYSELNEMQRDTLSKCGVEEKHVEELDTILREDHKDTPVFGKKLLGWINSVSTSLAARGIYDSIPKITEFAHQLM